MADRTAWQIIYLTAAIAVAVVGLAAIASWYGIARWRAERENLGPEERAARALGEAIAQCDGSITTATVNELFHVFSRATLEKKLAIVAAIEGMFAAADDGPTNLTDLDGRLVAIVRQLAQAPDLQERPVENAAPVADAPDPGSTAFRE